MTGWKAWLSKPLFDKAPDGFRIKAIAGLAFLFFLGLKVTHGLSQHMDLLYWDEANYMKAGSYFVKHINKEWGPAYAAWYQVGYVLIRDFLKLYFFNQAVLAILVPMLFYLLLIRTRVNTLVALLISGGLLCASFNLPMWPKVSHFCVAMLLVGLLAGSFARQAFFQWLWVALGIMLASFARPELYLAFTAVLLITIFVYFISRPVLNKGAKWALVFIGVIMLFFHIKIGIPILNVGRSEMAFAQHFTYNVIQQKNLPLDFWIVWPEICREYFGNATGFSGAWKANQDAVSMHVSKNLKNYLNLVLQYPAESVFPKNLWRLSSVLLQQALLLALLLYGILKVRKRSAKLPGSSWMILLIFFFFAGPAFLASLVIYPREHYFFLQLPFFLFLIALPFTDDEVTTYGRRIWLVVILPVFMYFLAPTAGKFEYFHLWHSTEGTPNTESYKLMRRLKGVKKLVIMESEGGMKMFIKGAEWVRGFEKLPEQGFYDFLAKKDPDIIYVTPALTRDPRYVLDGQWMVFVLNPASFGYVKVPLSPSNNFYLLVRNKAPYNTIVNNTNL